MLSTSSESPMKHQSEGVTMAKPSGKSKGATSSEKNAGKNVLLTAEEHAARKRDSKANKKRRTSGLGNARGTLLHELERHSYQTAANNRAANQSDQRIAVASRIARTTRSVV